MAVLIDGVDTRFSLHDFSLWPTEISSRRVQLLGRNGLASIQCVGTAHFITTSNRPNVLHIQRGPSKVGPQWNRAALAVAICEFGRKCECKIAEQMRALCTWNIICSVRISESRPNFYVRCAPVQCTSIIKFDSGLWALDILISAKWNRLKFCYTFSIRTYAGTFVLLLWRLCAGNAAVFAEQNDDQRKE